MRLQQHRLGRFEGWRIAGTVAVAAMAASLLLLAWYGANEDGVRAIVRNSARSSLILFLLAFAAASAHGLLRHRATAWLLRNRRYIGVSFAISHLYHLFALLALALWFPHPFLDQLGAPTLIGGGIAYLFIAAMAATSFDRSRAYLGPTRWSILHTLGSYYLWAIFAQSYGSRALNDSAYLPYVAALLAVILLRAASALRRHRRTASARPGAR